MRKSFLLCCCLCFLVQQLFAQSSIQLKVEDIESHALLNGVVVAVESAGAQKPVVYFSDYNGNVSIPADQSVVATISLIGYQTIQDTLFPSETKTISLTRQSVVLHDVTVTGQYDINTTDKSVYNVKVIERKTLDAMHVQNLNDLLVQQQSVRLTYDPILGSDFTMNGLGGENVKILVDGVPVIGRQDGNINLNQINLNDVERVEIVEGPMSVIYGTDAAGGCINLIAKKTSSYPLELNANGYVTGTGILNFDGSGFYRWNHQSLSLSGGRYFFEGYSDPDTSRSLEWKPYLQYFGSLNYNFNLKNFSLSSQTQYFNEEIQNKGAIVATPYQAYAFDSYYYTTRIGETLDGEWRLKNSDHIQLLNSYSYYKHRLVTYRKDMVTLKDQLVDDGDNPDSTIFNSWVFRGVYYGNKIQNKLHLQAGYDINLNNGYGSRIESGIQTINDYAAFGTAEYRFDSLSVQPGLRFAYNNRYGAPLIPSINLKYNFPQQFILRAAYARGFRAPELKELYLYFEDVNHNILGNPNLLPEHSNNFNASLSWSKIIQNKTGITADLYSFYSNVHNIIMLALVDQTTSEYSYVNIARYKTLGGHISAQLKTSTINYMAGFAYTGIYDTVSAYARAPEFTWTPEVQQQFTYYWKKPQIDASFFLKYTGKTPGFTVDGQGHVNSTYIDPYTIADVSFSKYFWNRKIVVSAGVKNLFDVDDIRTNALQATVHSSGGNTLPYATGRTYFIGLNLHWHNQ